MSNPQPPADGAPAGQRQFLRVLGPVQGVAIVVGTVIGSGIFRVPQSMIQNVGSVPLVFLVWVSIGLLVYFGYGMRHSQLAR